MILRLYLLTFTVYSILYANGVTYTDAKIQGTALHLFELLNRQFLGNSPKITNQLFFKNLFGWLL